MSRFRIYWNGKPLTAADCRVSFFNRTLQFGEGLFETIRVTGGRPVFLREHLDRLGQGIDYFGFLAPDFRGRVTRMVLHAVRHSGWRESRLKLMLLAEGAPGDTLQDGPKRMAWVILVFPLKTALTFPVKGISLMPVDQVFRSPLAVYKTFAYAGSARHVREARKSGFQDILYLYQSRYVLESSIANIFFMRERTLLTPGLDLPILNGITREKILAATRMAGMKAREKRLSLSEAARCDTAFLTNSTQGIRIVSRIGDMDFPGGNSHLVSLWEAYMDLVARDLENGG